MGVTDGPCSEAFANEKEIIETETLVTPSTTRILRRVKG